jgi:integrase
VKQAALGEAQRITSYRSYLLNNAENQMNMNKEYYQKRMNYYLRMIGSKSISTHTVYHSNLDIILNRFPEPDKATLLEIQEFAYSFENDNTRKNICVIIRWLYNKVLGRNIQWFELPYSKRKQKVQPIYSHEEAMKILDATKSEKQKAILALIIDCGLRISEPCSIYISDCNSKERKIILRSTKGDSDRAIYPSQAVWDLIKSYWNGWWRKPTTYLFEGGCAGGPYTTSSIRQFVRRSCKICGVEYKAVHSFRRYLITWSIENKVDITAVADKVGHKGINTIQKHYLIHSANYLRGIESPLSKAV